MTAAYYQGKINFADKKDATADGNKNVTINGNGWGGYLVRSYTNAVTVSW